MRTTRSTQIYETLLGLLFFVVDLVLVLGFPCFLVLALVVVVVVVVVVLLGIFRSET